ncbi:MAG: DUF5683 domain-containing protein [Odoribacteraceae bacterium]|jgi:hypothetical protein|nr:DUF5683 domain-containing protein [Odoribacteraceae bacterium]
MNKLLKVLLLAVIISSAARGVASPVAGGDTLVGTLTSAAGGTFGGTQVVSVKIKEKKPHSPRKATFMAMGLPGLGQIYNGHWWKLPILYGGAGAAVYGFDWNQRFYKTYREAFVGYTQYMNAKAADPDLPYPRPNTWDKLFKPGGSAENINPQRFQTMLKDGKNNFKRDRDLLLIVMGGIYMIQILDATVFAHFYEYEISDDLSLRVLPSAGFDPRAGSHAGISLTLRF